MWIYKDEWGHDVINVKSEKNSIFLKKGKTVICYYSIGGNLDFFYILDDEMDFIVGIVSRNLVT